MRLCTITVQEGAMPNNLDMGQAYVLHVPAIVSMLRGLCSTSRNQNPITESTHEEIQVSGSSSNVCLHENCDS
jgi:hypothetical protein